MSKSKFFGQKYWMNDEATNGIMFDTIKKQGHFLTNIGLVPLNNEKGEPIKDVKGAREIAHAWGYPEVKPSKDGESFLLVEKKRK